MSVRVGINGFGRIGRNILRASLKNNDIECIVINDLADAKTLAHLLKYDSIFGVLEEEVRTEGNSLFVGDREIWITSERDPEQLPWSENNVDIVLECTGLFTKREAAEKHIKAGAKKVLISAPATDEDITIVMGVNDEKYDPEKHHIISNASCTTNCLAPLIKVLNDKFELAYAMMTTVHSYTNDQRILDLPHSDLRRTRAAAVSMIPTTTGAARAVGKVLPELEGMIEGMSIRVPTPNVSMIDVVAIVEKEATAIQINNAVKEAANGPLKGILGICDDPCVSIDYKGNPHSSVVDSSLTTVLGSNMVKVIAWYDNEWGFSNRMLDLVKMVVQKGL